MISLLLVNSSQEVTLSLSSLCTSGLPQPYAPRARIPGTAFGLSVSCQGTGFGSQAKTAAPKVRKDKPARQGASTPAASSPAADTCPCGGGTEKKSFKECCSRFHGGVKEPNALSLLKARYSAFARGVIPYLVRTTHADMDDLKNAGAEKLTADCRETCNRVVFKRLDVGTVEVGGSEDEAFISFRAVYAYKHGTTTENQLLEEKSKFVREGDRWFYREKLPLDAVSDALWRHGALLAEKDSASSAMPKGVYGRAQPKLRPRGR